MVDYEVESTLREIRERVLADSAQANGVAPLDTGDATGSPAGVDSSDAARAGASEAARGVSGEALARMRANLATTERAWSRLPPVMSYRRGAVARFELWLKRQVKRALHWFTWEQVNFNSAAHHALADAHAALANAHEVLGGALAALDAHERALEELRGELRRQQSEAESTAAANAARLSEIRALLDAFESRLGGGEARLSESLARLTSDLGQVVAEQRAGVEQLRAESREQIRARVAELRDETRERVEHALEEQRVCFKQLSLEASESAVTQDRARRRIEARIEALEAKDVKSGA